jgi:hypothetical protein
VKHILMNAKQEIIDLRRRNEILSAQMAIVDVFAAALGLHRDSGAMGPDVAWELQQEIDAITAAEERTAQPAVAIKNDQRF